MPNKNNLIVFVCAIVVTVIAFLPPANAAQVDLANPVFAEVAGSTSIPVGAAEFCRMHRDECRPNASVADAITLTEALWTELLEVNAGVNGSVVPVTDEQLYQVAEYWTYPQGYGDCEDIALEKRRALIEAGWDPSVLLMAVVREKNGNGHAVLMVRTDRGDLVLDNQDGMIMVWAETPYQFVKRQSQANPGQWVDFVDNRASVVTATASN
jgi:predicted transglutaminase-like cysteine proteinase